MALNLAELVAARPGQPAGADGGGSGDGASSAGESGEPVDGLALIEAGSGRELTWAALESEVERVARGLAGLGLVAGYRVMIVLPNRIEFVAGYLGILRARLVAVGVNPESSPDELARVMTGCGARAVLADASTLTAVRAAARSLPDGVVRPHVIAVGDIAREGGETGYDELPAGGPAAVPAGAAQDPEALAALLYTGGTSGVPRAAMLTHRALLANIEQVASVQPPLIGTGDVVLGVVPLFHVYGLGAVLGAVLRHHATLVLLDGFDAEGSLEVVRDHGVTVLPVAPAALAYWLGVDGLASHLTSVRLVLCGSAPAAPELVREFEARTGKEVHQGYGLTEAAPVVTSTLCSRAPRPGSVGAALPGIEIRLTDEDGLPPEGSDPGLIEIRGANLFSGYWPDGADGTDEDGWYATGDLGFLDPDGDLFLVDRAREVVVVSGFTVYPVEVEEVVEEVAGVAEAAVIGVPDPATGEAVVAYVVPAAPGLDTAELEGAVREHCHHRLARFKLPREIQVVDELPHTAIGQVAKGRLRSAGSRTRIGLLE